MQFLKWATRIALALAAVLYVGNGITEHFSGRNVGPEIACEDSVLEVSVYDGPAVLLAGVTARDAQDGDLSDRVIIGGVSKIISGDRATVEYLVFDSDDNMASCLREVRYRDYRRPTFALTAPLVYPDVESAKVLERVTVSDMLDGDLTDQARVATLWKTERGDVFSATVMVTNSMGDTATVDFPVIVRTEGDGVALKHQIFYMAVGEEFRPGDHVLESGPELKIRDGVDETTPGNYWVWYEEPGSGDFSILTVVVE